MTHPRKPSAIAAAVNEACYRCALVSIGATGLFAGIALLYLIKSAAGVDLLDGPSPLHSLFY